MVLFQNLNKHFQQLKYIYLFISNPVITTILNKHIGKQFGLEGGSVPIFVIPIGKYNKHYECLLLTLIKYV